MPDVFVSYARVDAPFVETLVARLRQADLDVWWDPAIEPGTRFADVIQKALDSAKCVLVVWSRASINSSWVKDEAAVGLDRKILVPVAIEGVQPPLGFRQIQTLDLAALSAKAANEKLLTAVRNRVANGPDLDQTSPTSVGALPLAAVRPFLRNRNLGIAVVLLAVFGGAVAGYSFWPTPEFRVYEGYGIFDATGDLQSNVSLADCRSLCRASAGCKAYSYFARNKSCFLNKTYADMRPADGFSSGVLASLPQPVVSARKR